MKTNSLRGSAQLLGAALIWGLAFVAQSVGMEYMGPFTFNCIRSLLGVLALAPVIAMMDRRAGRARSFWGTCDAAARRTLVKGGVACGLALAVGCTLQQYGIRSTTVAKAGFITALYIVFVPLLGLALGRRAGWHLWLSVLLATGGMYLLCMKGRFALQRGDVLLLLSACCFAVHIVIVDHVSSQVEDCVRLSALQFLVCGLVCLLPMLLWDRPAPSAVLAGWLPTVYAGVFSCGGAYTLQVLGQRDVPPALASLLLSMESVFSVLAGWLLLGQTLSVRELSGCALVFCAVLLAQAPVRRKALAGGGEE